MHTSSTIGTLLGLNEKGRAMFRLTLSNHTEVELLTHSVHGSQINV